MTEWASDISLGEIKCGRLKPHSNDASFRSTVANVNRRLFSRGLAIHARSYWKENAVGIYCVPRKTFDEHKNDPTYENEWQCKIDDVYNRILEDEKSH